MIPLALFLLACALIYLGAIDTAFSTMMRLSLRLVAERNGRGDGPGRYFDEPNLLLVPLRLTMGVVIAVASILASRVSGPLTTHGTVIAGICLAGFVVICQHLVPSLLVRRDPERALAWLLPPFRYFSRVLSPVTL